jgi:uncharacterized membrane protein YeaQ/YmgE (transglycosylase-associated protein family)
MHAFELAADRCNYRGCYVQSGLWLVVAKKRIMKARFGSTVPQRSNRNSREVEMMHWIWTILIGFVAGLIAKAVTPGAGPSGFWLTAILGIAGAIAATFIGQLMGLYAEGQPAGFIASVLGAVILLVIYHLIARKSQ